MANPYGVIFDGDKKAYVGSPHGKPLSLTPEVRDRVLRLVNMYGVWYEGDGGDVASDVHIFGKKSAYRGSWDDAFAKSVEGYPPEFLSGIFANTAVNGQLKAFLDPTMTIFDSLLKHQKGMRYFKNKAYDAETLTKFLRMISDDAYDFLAMSQKRATRENLSRFLSTGEKRANPPNWDEYPYKIGKVAKKSEDARNQFLLERPAGVYVAGAGHLVELIRLKPSLKMIGGARAKD